MVKGISASGCCSSAYPEALAEFEFKLSCSCPGEPQFEKVSFCLNEGNLFSFFLSPLPLSEGELECKGELQT